MNKKAIIFDLGRVLVDLDIDKGIFAFFGADPSKGMDNAVQEILDNPVFKKFNQGAFGPEEFYQQLKKLFGLKMSFEEFADKWCGIFSVMPGMYELVEKLSKNYKLGLLSDTDPMHWRFLKTNYPITKFFAKPVLSYEVKITKPAVEIFRIAAKSVEAEPENCIYIDDLPKNVAGAESVGMKGIKFISAEQLAGELAKEISF